MSLNGRYLRAACLHVVLEAIQCLAQDIVDGWRNLVQAVFAVATDRIRETHARAALGVLEFPDHVAVDTHKPERPKRTSHAQQVGWVNHGNDEVHNTGFLTERFAETSLWLRLNA